MSTTLDAEDKEDIGGMNNIDHKSASPYTIHTAALPMPSIINANINGGDGGCLLRASYRTPSDQDHQPSTRRSDQPQ